MNGKYTPGPWHWGPINQAGVPDYISGPRGQCIAWGVVTPQPHEIPDEAVANARLIVAAPDMLDAIKLLLTVIDSRAEHGAIATLAREVVVKVTGKSP